MFHRNAKLKSIIFPKGVLAIRPMAFRRCSALAEVVFSPVLERIDDRAFSYCDSLEQLSFPPALQTVGPRAFAHCKSLKKVQCESVVNIGEFAFSDSPSLSSVNLGSVLRTSAIWLLPVQHWHPSASLLLSRRWVVRCLRVAASLPPSTWVQKFLLLPSRIPSRE